MHFHFKTKIEFSHKLTHVRWMKKKCSTLFHEWSHIEIYTKMELKICSYTHAHSTYFEPMFMSVYFLCCTCILHTHTQSGLKANFVLFDWICEFNLRMQCHLRIPHSHLHAHIYLMLRRMPSHLVYILCVLYMSCMHPSVEQIW